MLCRGRGGGCRREEGGRSIAQGWGGAAGVGGQGKETAPAHYSRGRGGSRRSQGVSATTSVFSVMETVIPQRVVTQAEA